MMNPRTHCFVLVLILVSAINLHAKTNFDGDQDSKSTPAESKTQDDEQAQSPVVRLAYLEIDPSQLEAYTAAVKEEMEVAVRVEPGVLAIYAVADEDDPTKFTFFELYEDEDAYESHRESPHFKEYLKTTNNMITSRKLTDAVPIQLNAK